MESKMHNLGWKTKIIFNWLIIPQPSSGIWFFIQPFTQQRTRGVQISLTWLVPVSIFFFLSCLSLSFFFPFFFSLTNPKIFKYKQQPWLCFTWIWDSRTRLHYCIALNSFQTQSGNRTQRFNESNPSGSFMTRHFSELQFLSALYKLTHSSDCINLQHFGGKKWHPSPPSCLFSSLLSLFFLILGLRRSMVFPLTTRRNFVFSGLQFIKQILHSCHKMHLKILSKPSSCLLSSL